jgi:hypothetical protein
MRTRHLNELLIVANLVISTSPLYAEGQQQNVAKLKADAQKLVSTISADEAKTRAYCQIAGLGGEIEHAVQDNDENKTEELMRRLDELEKQLGPDYQALLNALFDMDDPDSKDVQDILSMLAGLDESCPH